jgi:hypothetical protein
MAVMHRGQHLVKKPNCKDKILKMLLNSDKTMSDFYKNYPNFSVGFQNSVTLRHIVTVLTK